MTIDVAADPRNLPFVAEFKAEPAYAKSWTLEEYVAMRRVDEGIDHLHAGWPKGAKQNFDSAAETKLAADERNLDFIREYKAEPRYSKTMTLGEYVGMRRVDMGIDELKAGSMVEPSRSGELTPSGAASKDDFGAGLDDDGGDPLSYTEVHHPEALKAMQQTFGR